MTKNSDDHEAIRIPCLAKPVVLVGMMGAGKSTIGVRLAKALNIPFYDSDHVLEKEQGRSIPDIFEQDGEAAFRVLEAQTIQRLLHQGICVLATGGGAVTNEGSLQQIRQYATSIWLRADPETLLDRVKGSTRPLLKGDDPLQKLRDILSVRKDAYAQADIVIDTAGRKQKDIVQEILQTLMDC